MSFSKAINNIRIISIAAGVWHSACVTDSGQVFAWGLANDGQLGINPKTFGLPRKLDTREIYIAKPTLVESLGNQNVVNISCGSNYSVVRTADNKVFAFGNGTEGVLGNGNTSCTFIPQEIVGLSGIELKKIACGWNHCLALTKTGTVYEWGNQYKDIFESAEPILYPQIVADLENYRIRDIACGDYHSCALSAKNPNGVFTWGSNGYGQLGDPTLNNSFVSYNPILLRIDEVAQVVCGGLFTMVRLKNSSVIGWGCNRQKQIGNKLANIINEPELVVSNNSIIKRIGCGYSHVYFLSSEPVQKYLLINSEIQNKAAKYETSKDYTDDRDASN